jgi:hypothetical protein
MFLVKLCFLGLIAFPVVVILLPFPKQSSKFCHMLDRIIFPI